MNTFRIVCLSLLCWGLSLGAWAQEDERAQIIIESIEGPKPYSSLDVKNNAANFQFVIVTDRTGGHRPGVFEEGIRKVNLLQPEFVMSVGDLIEGYTEDVDQLNQEWDEFTGFIDKLEAPFFYIPGNHDITNKVMEDKWKERFGPTYYHFKYQDVLFLCLNSEDNYRGAGRGTIDDAQYEYIKKTLEENQDVRWTLVFMHQPLWLQENTKRWQDVEKLLATRQHNVFVGHVHHYVKYERNNGKYFTLATTGGSNQFRGERLGEFDHVVWVTMTDEGPMIANLLLKGIWDEDVTTEKMADFGRPLAGGSPVTIDPIISNNTRFNGTKTQIKLTNDSDALMEVDLEFVANTKLLPNFGSQQYTIQPNSVEIVDLGLKAREALAANTLEPLQLKAHITYKSDDLPEISFDKNFLIRPEIENVVSKTKSAIKVDGDLSEWAQLNFSVKEAKYKESDPFSHQGPEDASFDFAVTYDDNFLYIAANVTDDEIITNKNKWADEQDALFVHLDARPERISANATGTWRTGRQFILIPDFSQGDQTQMFRQERLPEGSKAIAKKTKQGYICEFAIPLTYIKTIQGSENWKSFRLNVYQSDSDKEAKHQSMIYWRPSWGSEDNYVGSGIFHKNEDL